MKIGEPGLGDEGERLLEHRLVLGRKAGDQVGAEDDAGPGRPQPQAEPDHVGPQMPPLHPLEDQIIAGLHAQMDMRHEARLARQMGEELVVDLGRIERGEPEPRQLRHGLEDHADQPAERRPFLELAAE